MTTESYISIITWLMGGLTTLFAFMLLMIFRLKTGQDVTHLRLHHIEKEIDHFRTNAEKIRTDFDISHGELKDIRNDIFNIRRDVDRCLKDS